MTKQEINYLKNICILIHNTKRDLKDKNFNMWDEYYDRLKHAETVISWLIDESLLKKGIKND